MRPDVLFTAPLILLFAALLLPPAASCKGEDAPKPTGDQPASAQATPTPAPTPEASKKHSKNPASQIVLNGTETSVRWSDGDSFRFLDGPYKGNGVRLMGFNTLESYGPVHQWGDWTADELYEIARTSKKIGSAGKWTCTTDGSRDAYKRVLVSCPEAALAIVQAGHGHVFAIDAKPDPALVKAQKKAQKAKVGMWAKGVPALIITSLHSADEPRSKKTGESYNRVADTRTGQARKVKHSDTYGECQNVCLGPKLRQSCLIYVPFEHRYKNKAECLRRKK